MALPETANSLANIYIAEGWRERLEVSILEALRAVREEDAKIAEAKFEGCCADEYKCDMEKAGIEIAISIRAKAREK